jgi:hypothetical protein
MKTYTPNLSGVALKRLGVTLILAAPAAILVGLWILGKLDELGKLHGGFLGSCLELGVLGLVAFYLKRTGQDWYKHGKQRSAPRAESLISNDTRPPVVYLRSFEHDSVAAQGEIQYGGGGPQGWHELSWVAETEEEQLAQVMNEIGPFVALGKPGETLPEIGAARMYVGHDEWQSEVLELIRRARLVVLRAGETANFLWEFEMAVKNLKPQSVIVLLPYDAAQYKAFRKKVEASMPGLPFSLPDYFPAKPRGIWFIDAAIRAWKNQEAAGSIRGVLYFEPQWKPELLELRSLSSGIPNPLAQGLKTTLEPVFKQLGVPWKRPSRWFVRRYRA